MKWWKYCSVFIFIWAVVIVQLYYEDRYFNMLQAKAHIYLMGAAIGVCLTLITLIHSKYSNAKEAINPSAPVSREHCGNLFSEGKKISSELKPNSEKSYLSSGRHIHSCLYIVAESMNALDIIIIVFGAVGLVSSLLSLDAMTSLTGLYGWGVGGAEIACFALFYFVLSRYPITSRKIWIVFIAVCSLIFIIGILHSAYVDVLGLHRGIRKDQYYWYISTIGNLNWYVGYLCLTVPVLVAFFLEAESQGAFLILLGVTAISCAGMVLSACDGLYLGIGCCAFAGIPYVLRSRQRTERMGIVIALYGLSLLLIKLCPAFSHKSTTYSGISDLLLSHIYMGILITLFGIFVHVVFVLRKNEINVTTMRLIVIALESVLTVATIAAVIKTATGFSDGWGTERGLIWKYYIGMYKDLDFKGKLLGVGPEMLYFYSDSLAEHFQITVNSAHSSFVQTLLTMGALGAVCWSGIWISAGILFVQSGRRNCSSDGFVRGNQNETAAAPLFISLCAFFGQSMVYSTQAANMSLFCVILALFTAYRKISVREIFCLRKESSNEES